MIVHRDVEQDEASAEKLGALRELARRGDATGFLLELGELEQAALDAGARERDGWAPLQRALRLAMVEAGRAFVARDGALLQGALDAVARTPDLPARLRVRPPEGYAHYALDPDAYAQAAERYLMEEGERAGRALVLGVRSIGTSLSAVVAAVVGSRRTLTVRPRGAAGQREVVADAALEARLARWLEDAGDVLVVDEGPGVTGETFQAVAAWLGRLGVPDSRMVLFPSRTWGMAAAPPERVAWFERARKYAPPLEDPRPARIARAFELTDVQDLSGGRWREVVPGAREQPAMAARERLKLLGRGAGGGERWLVRYVGLGRRGETLARRAEALAAAGLAPGPAGLRDGFIRYPWLEGQPLSCGAGNEPTFVRALSDYLAARAPLFRTGRVAEVGPVIEMLRQNAEAALGAAAPGVRNAVRRLELLPPREAVLPDARLHPREWLRHDGRYLKVDALDHGDGIWLPGPADAAWDLAGAAVEHALDDAVAADLARRCAAALNESCKELAQAAHAYRPAYAAYAFAEATLSSWEAPDAADRRRLEVEAERYRCALREALPAGD